MISVSVILQKISLNCFGANFQSSLSRKIALLGFYEGMDQFLIWGTEGVATFSRGDFKKFATQRRKSYCS